MAGREAEKVLRPWDFGRKGYREVEEPTDERPVIRGTPFWEYPIEQAVFERAVKERPINLALEGKAFVGYGEGLLDYLQEIVKRATGKDAEATQAMPQVRVPGEEG
jgi:hypothetical protein